MIASKWLPIGKKYLFTEIYCTYTFQSKQFKTLTGVSRHRLWYIMYATQSAIWHYIGTRVSNADDQHKY